MIPDTSAQDRQRSPQEARRGARRRGWLAVASGGGLVAVLVGLVSAWSAGSHSIAASSLRIATVSRGELVRDLSAEARVITANSPTLYAIAGGTVHLDVVAGDAVVAGQELARIDSPELRSRLVQEASTLASLEGESRRAGLDARLARFEAQKLLDQAEVEQTAARRELERMQRAFDLGAVPRNDLDRAQDNLRKAEIGVAAARESHSLQLQGTGIDADNKRLMAVRQKAVVEELQRQVDALTLRAPFAGQVGQVQVVQGANVAINAPILSVVDLTEFEVEVRVPESFARDLVIGVPAEVRANATSHVASVAAVSPEVVNGEVTARLRFGPGAQPPGLRQNQRLSARIVLDRREDVLRIERGPSLDLPDGHFVWVVEAGSAVRRPIRFGVAALDAVEVISGLQAGDRVVISGAERFDNADKVRISGE